MAFARRHLLALQAALISFLLLPDIFRSFSSTKVTWSVTELLINFQAGFVRRGLLGELLRWVCVHTGLSMFTVISLLFLAATVFIVWAMTRLLQPYAQRYPVLTALLLFSPGLLMFPINEYAAYARKEVFIVIGLLVHALMARRFAAGELSDQQIRRFYLLALLPMLTLFTFIHEVQLFFLPAHAGMMFLAAWQRRVNLQWLFLIYLVPAAAALAMLRFPGNAGMVPGIVDSLRPMVHIEPGREGAIEALGWPMSHFTGLAAATRHDPRSITLYSFAWILAVIVPLLALGPVAIRHAPPDDRPLTRRIGVFMLLICLAPVPLYILGADFGRWIYLTAFSVVSLLLSLPIHVPPPAEPSERRLAGFVMLVLCGIYIGGWTLPHYGTNPPVVKSGLARSVWRSSMLVMGKNPVTAEQQRHELAALTP
jgi:hypothetical protein